MKYTLAEITNATLLCLMDGHYWEEAPCLVTRHGDGTTTWRRTQKCERPGCPRERVRDYEQHTMRPIGQYRYQGDHQSLEQRAYKADLVFEIIERQKKRA